MQVPIAPPIPSRAGVTLVILIHVHYYSNSERSRVLRQQRFIIYLLNSIRYHH